MEKCSIPLVDGPNRLAKQARSPQFPPDVNNTKGSPMVGFGTIRSRQFNSSARLFCHSGIILTWRSRFSPPIRGGSSGVYVTKKAMCGCERTGADSLAPFCQEMGQNCPTLLAASEKYWRARMGKVWKISVECRC